ncbi:MAG: acetoin utilization protein AcuC [Armatimonadetes bacterium]|nr:acetoin utilization protein AcuC [Armatimonadota bacterium]
MSARFFFHPDTAKYDFGPRHPLRPERYGRTFQLLECHGFWADRAQDPARLATRQELETVHDPAYIDAVIEASQTGKAASDYGLGYHGDNPPFIGMHHAASAYCGATLAAADAVVEGAQTAVNIGGGLHHAQRALASGFCIYNDPALAVRRLQSRFARVAYIDIDLHHGDGVQALFYDDPTVMTLSIHESGRWLYPGTGFVSERGEGTGVGTSLNLPMAPCTPDDIWQEALFQFGLPAVERFKPDAIVLQMGCDPHHLDPLGHLSLTAQGWLEAVRRVRDWRLPTVALGGGGYNMSTVPRMWAAAMALLDGVELPDETPTDCPLRDEIPTLFDHAPFDLSPAQIAVAKEHWLKVRDELRSLGLP